EGTNAVPLISYKYTTETPQEEANSFPTNPLAGRSKARHVESQPKKSLEPEEIKPQPRYQEGLQNRKYRSVSLGHRRDPHDNVPEFSTGADTESNMWDMTPTQPVRRRNVKLTRSPDHNTANRVRKSFINNVDG